MSRLLNCPVCGSSAFSSLEFTSKQEIGEYEIGECLHCTHQFLSDPPSSHELKTYYDSFYKEDIRTQKPGKPTFRDYALVRTLIPHLPQNAHVLDIGANFGSTLLAFPQSYTLEGVELSKPAADAAERSNRLTIHRSAIEDIDLPDSRFDCIVSLAVIEHIANTNSFLAKITKLLKPGGILLLMTGDYRSWSAQKLERNWHLYHSGGHLHFFSGESLEHALGQHGIEPYERIWVGPNKLTFKLPTIIGRPLHCQTTSLLLPMLFARKPQGDHIFIWGRSKLRQQ